MDQAGTPQYVFGDGLLSAAKNIFKEKGLEHVGNSYYSLAEKEFSGYLTNAMAAKPDVLLLLNFGSQSSDALRQAVSFGMHKNMTILIAWASGLEQFESLGADLCEGVYFGAQYWHTADAPLNLELVKRSNDKFKANPNYSMAGSYICTKLLIDGIIKAGTVDQKAVIAALEGMKYAGLTGEEEVRKGDHQVLKNYYLLKGKAQGQDDQQGRLRGCGEFRQVLPARRSDGLQARLTRAGRGACTGPVRRQRTRALRSGVPLNQPAHAGWPFLLSYPP